MRINEIERRSSPVDITIDEIAKKYPLAFEKMKKNIFIFRGIRQLGAYNKKIFYANSLTKERNANNLYNAWIDTTSEWSNYPKRSKSFICTNKSDLAGSYGDLFVCVPINISNIGICPTNDIQSSFNNNIGGAFAFYTLITIFKNQGILTADDIETHSIMELLEIIQTAWDKNELSKKDSYINNCFKINNSIIDTLHYEFDPDNHKFQLTSYENYSLNSNSRSKEIWFSGECYFIEYSKFEDWQYQTNAI